MDWGYKNGLRLWYGNNLKLFSAADQTSKPSPNFVYIQHTDDKQMYDNVNSQLRDAALALGYNEQVERNVHDNQGRPVFEIFRFANTGTAPQ